MSNTAGFLIAAHLLISDAEHTVRKERALAEDRRRLADEATSRSQRDEEARRRTELEARLTAAATRNSAMVAGGGILGAIGLLVCVFLFMVAEDSTLAGAENSMSAPGFTRFAAVAALLGLSGFGVWYGYHDRDREGFSGALSLALLSGATGAMFLAGFSTVVLGVIYYADDGLAAVFPAAINGIFGGGFVGAIVGAVAGLLYCAVKRILFAAMKP